MEQGYQKEAVVGSSRHGFNGQRLYAQSGERWYAWPLWVMLRKVREAREEADRRHAKVEVMLDQMQAIADGIETRVQSARDEIEREAALEARAQVQRLLFGDDDERGPHDV